MTDDEIRRMLEDLRNYGELKKLPDAQLGAVAAYIWLVTGKIDYDDQVGGCVGQAVVERLLGTKFQLVLTWIETGLPLDQIIARLA